MSHSIHVFSIQIDTQSFGLVISTASNCPSLQVTWNGMFHVFLTKKTFWDNFTTLCIKRGGLNENIFNFFRFGRYFERMLCSNFLQPIEYPTTAQNTIHDSLKNQTLHQYYNCHERFHRDCFVINSAMNFLTQFRNKMT